MGTNTTCRPWKLKSFWVWCSLKMAAIQTCALITVMMGFLASTTFNQEFFRHRIIIIHCVLILLLLESRRLLQRENRGNQRRFWVRPIFTARKTYGCYHTLVQELRLGDREWYFKFIRMSPERFEHLLSLVAPRTVFLHL